MSAKRLKAIQDALDSGNCKTALKLCNAFLQKGSNDLCKALKAVALDGLDKREALQVANEVRKTRPTEMAVLMPVAKVLKAGGLDSEAMDMFDHAFRTHPDSEEIGVGLFECCARARDYSRQQQVAMKLYKRFNKTRYLQWAVASILHMARGSRQPATRTLQLAEMLLSKTAVQQPVPVSDGKTATEARHNCCVLLLHLAVFLEQQNFEAAIDVLTTHEKVALLPTDMLWLKLKVFALSQNWVPAVIVAYELLHHHVDQFEVAKLLIALVFFQEDSIDAGANQSAPAATNSMAQSSLRLEKISTTKEGPEEGDEAPPVHRVFHFDLQPRFAVVDEPAFQQIQSRDDLDRVKDDDEVTNCFILFKYWQRNRYTHSSRVPHLAELELRKIAFAYTERSHMQSGAIEANWSAHVTTGDMADFTESIVGYYDLEGQKGSCFFDLKPYLAILDEHRCGTLVHKLTKVLEKDDSNARDTAFRFRTLCRIQRACGVYPAPATMLSTAQSWMVKWMTSQRVDDSGVALDDLVALAAAILLDLDKKQVEDDMKEGRCTPLVERTVLLDTLAFLEMALKPGQADQVDAINPSAATQVKALLMVIYSSLGFLDPVDTLLQELNIRSIQHETLLPLVLTNLMCCMRWDSAGEWCKAVLDFHESYDRDLADAFCSCFEAGMYHRVGEFMRARESLSLSINRGRCLVELCLLELVQSQSLQAVQELLSSSIATKVAPYAMRSQSDWISTVDRTLFQSLHPLQRASPYATSHLAASGTTRFGSPNSTVAVSPFFSSVVGSLAIDIPMLDHPKTAAEEKRFKASQIAAPASSALEVMLAQHSSERPGMLRLRALLVHMLYVTIVRRERVELSRCMDMMRAAMTAEDLLPPCEPWLSGDSIPMSDFESKASEEISPLPYGAKRHAATYAATHFSRFILIVFEAAHRVLQCQWHGKQEIVDGGKTRRQSLPVSEAPEGDDFDEGAPDEPIENYRQVEQSFQVLTIQLNTLGDLLVGAKPVGGASQSSKDVSDQLGMGGIGVARASDFLLGPVAATFPLLMWWQQVLPYSEAGHPCKMGALAARSALSHLIVTLHAVLTNLQEVVARCLKDVDTTFGVLVEGAFPQTDLQRIFRPSFRLHRRRVANNMAGSQMRQLMKLADVVENRLVLLRGMMGKGDG
mmetsp:Transcript_53740/g.142918  ORF Transcript_53740/g.142918 Transcript_53740/m.142918 type:complete len:1160 (+) Transcript_53740:30-3509(+)